MASLSPRLLAHLEMLRPYTVSHPGLLAVAGAELASHGRLPPWRSALAALVTMAGWEAGHYAGDYYDREIDARSKPSRPVPSGRVSPSEAFLSMVTLVLAGYAAALALGLANLLLAVASTALGIAYSRAFKSRALLGNLDRGLLGVSAVLFGSLAGGLTARLPSALLAGLVFFHDAATNLVGAVRDVEGDRAVGCQTLPVVYGSARSIQVAAGLALGWVGLGAALLASLRPRRLPICLFGGAVGLAASVYVPLWRRRNSVTRARALAAHKVLVAERLVLMSAFIGVHKPRAALALLAITLPTSLGFQHLLRDRYEEQRLSSPASG